MRQAERHAQQVFFQQFTNPQFVRRVVDRPQEADRDGLHLRFGQARDDLHHGPFVERRIDIARTVDPLRHLEGERARHIGVRIGRSEVERLDPPALTQHQDIRVACRGQERCTRRVTGDNGVDGMGRAVDQHVALRQQIGQRKASVLRGQRECIQHTFHRIARRRGRLVHGQRPIIVLDDQVGKGAPGIAGKPHVQSPRSLPVGKPCQTRTARRRPPDAGNVTESGKVDRAPPTIDPSTELGRGVWGFTRRHRRFSTC